MKTILFQGPPRSGKDTCVEILKSLYPDRVHHLEVKEQLFLDTCSVFGVTLEWFMKDYETNKQLQFDELKGRSKRQALIYTAEDLFKKQYGSDYYGVKAADKLVEDRVNVFSDSGFPDEIAAIAKKSECLLVHVVRPGCDFSQDSRRYAHSTPLRTIYMSADVHLSSDSDPYLDEANWFDVDCLDIPTVCLYNVGSIQDLRQQVSSIWKDFV